MAEDERVGMLERQVALLRPDIPRFGREDFVRATADIISELRDEFLQRTSLSTEFLREERLSELPTAGVNNGATAWCSNGRGPSEASGVGTGVPVYFHESSGEWRDYRTGAEVAV